MMARCAWAHAVRIDSLGNREEIAARATTCDMYAVGVIRTTSHFS
ncbi:hypothetical protein BURMUCF1_A1330 [Burkholderia multivorans ATCC BAA-247]|nr:hypothetical protein BURMUCF1_A1330 [Burkholderia multivorans ATCC BAA-247]